MDSNMDLTAWLDRDHCRRMRLTIFHSISLLSLSLLSPGKDTLIAYHLPEPASNCTSAISVRKEAMEEIAHGI
jgi:hypothetical protein